MLWCSSDEIRYKWQAIPIRAMRAPTYKDGPTELGNWLDISTNYWWVCLTQGDAPYLWINLFESDPFVAQKKYAALRFEDIEIMKDAFDKHIRQFDPYKPTGHMFRYEFRKVPNGE